MRESYHCPNCHRTEVAWDRGLRKAVCPKDRTPVAKYRKEFNPSKR